MITPRFVGLRRGTALFEARGKAVLVNTKTLTASIENYQADPSWAQANPPAPQQAWVEVASAAIQRERSPQPISLSSNDSKRTYTVPKRVALSAQTALTLGGSKSPTANHVARLLSSGQQLTREDVLWVSRFFDNHADGQTTDRAIWLSWGGEEGKRWAGGLATRLDYDSVVADAGTYETPGVADFAQVNDDQTFWAALTEPRSQYATSLFKLTASGTWQAWGNGDWIECADPELSDRFVELDEEAALYMAGALFDAPDIPVDLRTPDPHAWDLAVAAYDEIDWKIIDRATKNSSLSAAGITPSSAPVSPVTEDYTPQERSENAEVQLRDANGRFAQVGDQGAIKSLGIAGVIEQADPATGQIVVKGADGQSHTIPASDFEVDGVPQPKVDPEQAKDSDLDLAGIVSEPKQPPTPRARLMATGPVLGPVEINSTLDEYSEVITATRQEKAKEFKKLLNDPEPETIQAAGEVAPEETPTTKAEDVPPPTPDPTPEKSDVEPIYLALVDRDDPRAVMDLVSLVPATATSSEPKTFRRSGGKWIEDPDVLQDLRSATPPPTVQLNADQLADVLAQIDASGDEAPRDPEEAKQTLMAAGNKGNAKDLLQYWTVGPGGMKIRWNTGGDWTRCVRLLSKYLGNRAKGYCALRHKEMTGMWPGDRKNTEAASSSLVAAGFANDSTDLLLNTYGVIRASSYAASIEAARMRVYNTEPFEPVPPSPEEITEGRSGRAFKIPLVIPEDLPTGDGRIFGKGALGMRTLPLPLMWQIKTGDGHDGSVLVGRIDRVERTSHGLGNAYGVFDTGPYGQEAQRLVETKMLRWVSADLDKFEVDESRSDPETGKMFISKGRLMGATLVPKPAFQECTIELVPLEEKTMPVDAVPSTIAASASIASAIPVEPPTSWFEQPRLNGPTPITVTDEGQLFGHIATWDTNHIGMAGQVRAPRSASNYAYFHTGVVRTNEGKDVKVGQLTLAGGHAPIHLDAQLAVRHYDDTASAIADVHAGEDSYGIWVAGALRPGTTPEQIRSLRASAPSGDWRAINNRLELVAVCQVNVPGFPVPRALAASGAAPTALVAAGMETLWAMRAEQTQPQAEAEEPDPQALVAAARERLYKVLDVDGYLTEFKSFSSEKREALAKEGKALADGSFPIENAADLRRAVHAYGRADESKKAKVRRHIVKRAKALGKTDLIPSNWKEASLSDSALANLSRYDELVLNANMKRVQSLSARVNSKEALAARAAALRARIEKK